MRIAIIAESFLPQMNGVVRMQLELLAYLRAHGHAAIVFAPGDGPTEALGFPVTRVPGLPFPPYPEVILAPFSLRMYRDLKTWRPDIIHLASPFLLGMQGVVVGRLLGVPVAAHFQTDVPQYAHAYHLGALAELAVRYLVTLHGRCALNYAPTPTIARRLASWGIEGVRVSGRGVDTRLFHPGRRSPALRRRYHVDDRDVLLLYVGRVSAEKNLGLLAATAAALPRCRLLIVGDGPERASLEAQMPSNVTFTGPLHGDALAAHYAAADLFVFPSLTETFGQVVQEAMAAGLPVVGMRAGGVQDIIQHGATGLLCDPGDDDAWLGAVRSLIEHDHARALMARNARAFAETRQWGALFDQVVSQYAAVVRGGDRDVPAVRH